MIPNDTDKANLTLDMALPFHREWKKKLQEAVASGTQLDAAAIRRDDCCDLGRWLYKDGSRQYGHTPEFTTLLSKHNDFHLVTSVVAEIINRKEYAQANALLQSSSQFSSASTDVALAIMRLKTAIHQQAL